MTLSHTQETSTLIAAQLTMALFVLHKIPTLGFLHITARPSIFFLMSAVLLGILFYTALSKKHTEKVLPKIIAAHAIILIPMVILLIGLNISENIIWPIHLLGSLYVITYGAAIIARYHKRNHTGQSLRALLSRPTQSTLCVLLVTMTIAVSFGFFHLKEQSLVDEPLWAFERIEKFWTNIAQRDWYNARPSDKPGVTTAAIAGVGLFFNSSVNYEKNVPNDLNHDIAELYYVFRVPLLLFVILLLPLCYFFLQNLLGRRTALVATAFIGTSPLLLGISRIINPDGLLWIFVTLTLLSYLCFIKKNDIPFLYAASVFLALALLTKYVANILILFLFLLIFLEVILDKEPPRLSRICTRLKEYAIFLFGALAVFFLLFPAVWLEHSRLLGATFFSQAFETTWPYFFTLIVLVLIDVFVLSGKILMPLLRFLQKNNTIFVRIIAGAFLGGIALAFVNIFTNDVLINAEQIIGSPKSAHQFASSLAIFFSGFYPLLFGSLPLVVGGSIISYVMLLRTTSPSHTQSLMLVTFSLFILLYYCGSAINDVAPTVRYQIVLYPLFAIIGALGIVHSITWCQKRWPVQSTAIVQSAFLIIFLSSTFILWHIAPHYFSYNSVLLPQQKIIGWKDMGDGSYEAAQWLNALPDAQEITVWADKKGVCAQFIGTCVSNVKHRDLIQSGVQFDYYVTSHGRQTRTTNMTVNKLRSNPQYLIQFDRLYDVSDTDAVFVIHPAKRTGNFVRIIEASTVDLSYTQK